MTRTSRARAPTTSAAGAAAAATAAAAAADEDEETAANGEREEPRATHDEQGKSQREDRDAGLAREDPWEGSTLRPEVAVASALIGVSQSPCPSKSGFRTKKQQDQGEDAQDRAQKAAAVGAALAAASPFTRRASELFPVSPHLPGSLSATPVHPSISQTFEGLPRRSPRLLGAESLSTPIIDGKHASSDALVRTAGSKFDANFVQDLFASPGGFFTPRGKLTTSSSSSSAISTMLSAFPQLPPTTGREPASKRRRPDSVRPNVDSALHENDAEGYIDPESPVQRIPSKYAAHVPTSASRPLGELVRSRKPLSPIPAPSPLRTHKKARTSAAAIPFSAGLHAEKRRGLGSLAGADADQDMLDPSILETPGKNQSVQTLTGTGAHDRSQIHDARNGATGAGARLGGEARTAGIPLNTPTAQATSTTTTTAPTTAPAASGPAKKDQDTSPPGARQIWNLEDAIRYSREVASRTPKPRSATRHQPCHCKRSQCLKLYCECFSLRLYCAGCNCTNCANVQVAEPMRATAVKAVLERNPLAFAPKIVKGPSFRGAGPQPQHNKGCACKKSGCLKRYCECFLSDVHCGPRCKCNKCQNFAGSQELERRRHVIATHEAQALAIQKARGHLEQRVRGLAPGPPHHVKFEQRGIAERLLKQPAPKPQVNLDPADDSPGWAQRRASCSSRKQPQSLTAREFHRNEENAPPPEQRQQPSKQRQQQVSHPARRASTSSRTSAASDPPPPPSSTSSSNPASTTAAAKSSRPTRHLVQYVQKRIKKTS